MTKDYENEKDLYAPEFLTMLKTHDYAVDVFALGIVFDEMIFKKKTFRKGKGNLDMMK
jgi:hypothetical protein